MDYSIGLAETYEILRHMEKEYIIKIPKDVLMTIKTQRAQNIDFKYDEKLTLLEQNVRKETIEILSYLYYTYISEGEEKEKLKRIYNQNFIDIENEKKEKFNSNNIFQNNIQKNKNDETDKAENTPDQLAMQVIKEESFLEKIWNKILAFFRRNKE